MVEVYDLPGIDDVIESVNVTAFIEKNLEFMIPVVVFQLTGSILDTVHFSKLIISLQRAQKIIIVFTHIENLITSTKHLIREEDESVSSEDLKA